MKLKFKKRKYLFSILTLPLITIPIIAGACRNEEQQQKELVLENDFKTTIFYDKDEFSFAKLANIEIDYNFVNNLLQKREISAKRHKPTDNEITAIIKEIIEKYTIKKRNFKIDKDILIAPLSALNPSKRYFYKIIDDNSPFVIKENSILYLKKDKVSEVYENNQINYELNIQVKDEQNATTNQKFNINFNKYDLDQLQEQNDLFSYSKNDLNIKSPQNTPEIKIEGFNNTELVQWSDLDIDNIFNNNLLNGFSPLENNKSIEISNKTNAPFYVDSIHTNISRFQGDLTKLKLRITETDNQINEIPVNFLITNRSLVTYEQSRVQFNNYLKNIGLTQKELETKIFQANPSSDLQLRLVLERYINNVYNFNFQTLWPINQVINKTSWTVYNFDFDIKRLIKKIELMYEGEETQTKPVINNFLLIKQPTNQNEINFKTTNLEGQDYKVIDSIDGIEFDFKQPSSLNGILIKKVNLNESLLREYLLPNSKTTYLVEIQDENNLNYNFVISKDIGYLNYLEIPTKFSHLLIKKIKIKPLTLKELIKDIKIYK